MNRKTGAILAAVIIVIFVGFIVYDIIGGKLFTDAPAEQPAYVVEAPAPAWETTRSIEFTDGKLKAIAVTADGKIVAGGTTFLTLLDNNLNREWTVNPGADITAIAVFVNTVAQTDVITYILVVNVFYITTTGQPLFACPIGRYFNYRIRVVIAVISRYG